MNSYNLTANYFHTVYKGKNLRPTDIDEVETFLLQELTSDGLNSLILFKEKNGIFQVLEAKSLTHPLLYWGPT